MASEKEEAGLWTGIKSYVLSSIEELDAAAKEQQDDEDARATKSARRKSAAAQKAERTREKKKKKEEQLREEMYAAGPLAGMATGRQVQHKEIRPYTAKTLRRGETRGFNSGMINQDTRAFYGPGSRPSILGTGRPGILRYEPQSGSRVKSPR